VTRPAAENELVGELKDRLASSCEITAQIQYSDLGPGLPYREGTLFFGKATLTDDLPFELLAHTSRNPSFPNDSTADQRFDFSQFDAYHALGRYVGNLTLTQAQKDISAAAQARARCWRFPPWRHV
jgi:hypothetical protein